MNHTVCWADPSRVSTLKAGERHHVRYGDRKWRRREKRGSLIWVWIPPFRVSVSKFGPTPSLVRRREVMQRCISDLGLIQVCGSVHRSPLRKAKKKKKFTVRLLAYTVAAGTLQDQKKKEKACSSSLRLGVPPRILYLLFFFGSPGGRRDVCEERW
jgi:hypothetical protein